MIHHAREIAPSVSWDILLRVKRSGGMSVNELCVVMKMSYMGVKQHCDALRKRGYLDTWRRAKGAGRPEKIYRPTEKLDQVLPQWGNELSLALLAIVNQLNGETAAERLLHQFFVQKAEKLALKFKGTTPKERLSELARLRTAEGCLCTVVNDVENGLRMVEQHNPLSEIERLYPSVCEMETRMIERILKAQVQRVASNLQVEFHISEPKPVGDEVFRLEA